MDRREFLRTAAAGCTVAASGSVISCGDTPAALAERTALAGTIGANARRAGLTVEGDHFLLDGERFQIIGGAIHYFRIHPDQWLDRLQRLRAMGLNTIETYVAWNFHQPTPGDADFTGWRDLGRFIRLAGSLGLKVVVRPGPYICAEWDFGGLPAWLLANSKIQLRCSDPEYEKALDQWFDKLLPHLAPLQWGAGGPIIAVQIENEYGSFGNDQTHLKHIEGVLRRHGIDSLLFCSNGTYDWMLRGGNLPGVLATANFSGDPTGDFEALRKFQPNGPLWCTEYWDGWFDHWGEGHHRTDPTETAAMVDKMLAMGASVNLYMAAGSSNFGFWAGANYDGHYQSTITSYDYDSPVGEAGELTQKFTKLREVIGKYAPLPTDPLPELPPRLAAQTVAVRSAATLFGALDRLGHAVHRGAPVPMEQLGQAYGMIHYRTRIQGPRTKATLTIQGLADWALVYLDGKFVGRLDRNTPKVGVDIAVPGEASQLDLLVDCHGRINFGSNNRDPKGINGNVLLGAQALFGWDIWPLPLDNLDPLQFGAIPASFTGPTFYRTSLSIPRPADGFLAFPNWKKGMVWLNGFLLGRYWDRGPQRRLYAPAPLWKAGRNDVVLLELHGAGSQVALHGEPDLG
ncbi:beta-galactosidase [Pendulispora rubella]|uniref:Beta-galactosidase n=1 Tax=Pendulispora rubella TaxID=2741070 RepID=A0ABZ2LEU8_9BACT